MGEKNEEPQENEKESLERRDGQCSRGHEIIMIQEASGSLCHMLLGSHT